MSPREEVALDTPLAAPAPRRARGRLASLLLIGLCTGAALLALAWLAARLAGRDGRPHAREARLSLLHLARQQAAYHRQHERFAPTLAAAGFTLARGNAYAYFLAAEGPVDARAGEGRELAAGAVIAAPDRARWPKAPALARFADTACPLTPARDARGRPVGLGIHGAPPADVLVAAAAGNLDDDPELDCWSVASVERTGAQGERIPAGVPYREREDAPDDLLGRFGL